MCDEGTRSARTAHRRGFTLVELLVVIAIISVLLALGVLIAPVLQSERAVRGAQDLQGFLEVAKQRSVRDESPRGVRLLISTNNRTQVGQFKYIEQPNPYTEGEVILRDVDPPPNHQGLEPQFQFSQNPTRTDPTNGRPEDRGTFTAVGQPSLWHVRVGDYFQINDTLETRRITKISYPTGATTPTFSLTFPTGSASNGVQRIQDFKIYRQPRPIAGEQVLQFPEGVIVDLNLSQGLPPVNTAQNQTYIDILFSGGSVINQQGRGKVILWVRDAERNIDSPGEQTLLTIYNRSGEIASHPVDLETDPNTGRLVDPYSFTRENRPSGQ